MTSRPSRPRRPTALRALLLLVCLTTACATARMYDGEPRPRDEVAVVEGWSGWNPFTSIKVEFLEVDGRPVEGAFTRDVELLPGEHELRVDASLGTMPPFPLPDREAEVVLTLDARPGAAYETRALRGTLDGVTVWIVDEDGHTVARALPDVRDDELLATWRDDGRGWRLVEVGTLDAPRVAHVAWSLPDEGLERWTELVELHVTAHASPADLLRATREQALRAGHAILSEDATHYAYRIDTEKPWQERAVCCARIGPSGLYGFTYALKSDTLADPVRDAWIARFLAARLREWPEDADG